LYRAGVAEAAVITPTAEVAAAVQAVPRRLLLKPSGTLNTPSPSVKVVQAVPLVVVQAPTGETHLSLSVVEAHSQQLVGVQAYWEPVVPVGQVLVDKPIRLEHRVPVRLAKVTTVVMAITTVAITRPVVVAVAVKVV
jgi:branched-subunit amino acid transport protein